MIRMLSFGSEAFRLTTGSGDAAGEGFGEIHDPLATADLFSRFRQDPHAVSVLRELAAEDPRMPDPSSLDDDDLVRALAGVLLDRGISLERLPGIALGTYGDEPVELEPAPVAAVVETTYVEFKVIDDRTNRPIKGVKLTITLPDGAKGDHTTNGDGLVTFDPVKPGSCALKTEIDGLRLPSTLELVGVGDGPIDEDSPEPEQKDGPMRVAVVEHHKVRTGESLDSLAKANGMTWKELAKFNFGTDDPKKINGYLRRVGCTKRTADKKNYLFSDSDDPGIIFIPRRLERAGMGTGLCHVLRVTPVVRPMRPYIFSY